MKKRNILLIILLCSIFLTTGCNHSSKEDLSNNNDKKEKTNIEEKVELYSNDNTYTLNLDKECNNASICKKLYNIEINNKKYKLEIDGSTLRIDNKKIKTRLRSIGEIAIIDKNIIALYGFFNENISGTVYLDNNFIQKTSLANTNYELLANKTGEYTTCEVKTCDDQTKRTYSYKLSDDATIKDIKLEKTEEHTFCTAQC